jgi:hypothetical protein
VFPVCIKKQFKLTDYATILLNRALNLKVIAERLGNTVEMIYTIYGHVLKELELRLLDLFAKGLATVGCFFMNVI